jgi:hypothetical protein
MIEDIDVYGIQQGDLWFCEEANEFFNLLVVDHSPRKESSTACIVIGTGKKIMVAMYELEASLVFRKGEVNKL